MSEQQVSDRGVEAANVLANPAYQEAMKALRETVIAKWREVGVRDTEGLRLTHQLMTLADTFESLLSGYVEAGKFAAHKLELDKIRDESPARKFMRRIL